MRLKVNQNLKWVIWGNDSAETSGAEAACEIKLPAQSSFAARLRQRQVPAVGAGSLGRIQFKVLNNRKSGKMSLSQVQAEVRARFCAVSCLTLSHGLFSLQERIQKLGGYEL